MLSRGSQQRIKRRDVAWDSQIHGMIATTNDKGYKRMGRQGLGSFIYSLLAFQLRGLFQLRVVLDRCIADTGVGSGGQDEKKPRDTA